MLVVVDVVLRNPSSVLRFDVNKLSGVAASPGPWIPGRSLICLSNLGLVSQPRPVPRDAALHKTKSRPASDQEKFTTNKSHTY